MQNFFPSFTLSVKQYKTKNMKITFIVQKQINYCYGRLVQSYLKDFIT